MPDFVTLPFVATVLFLAVAAGVLLFLSGEDNRPRHWRESRRVARKAAHAIGLSWDALDTDKFTDGFDAGLWFIVSAGYDREAFASIYELTLRRLRLERNDYELGWAAACRPVYLEIMGWQSDLFGASPPNWHDQLHSVRSRRIRH